jgi:hypothetical protein
MAKKRRREPEYSLHVFRETNERSRDACIVFLIETTKEFTNFNYQVLLDASVSDRTIQLKILGLRTTPLIMPGVGPARGRKDLIGLLGNYDLQVTKLNGESNHFRLHISRSQVRVDEAPASPFILISNQPVRLEQAQAD